MGFKLISPLKIMIVLLLLSISAFASAEQETDKDNSLRCESVSSQVTYDPYDGLFIKHQISGEKIKIGDYGDMTLECTNDEKWLIFYDKGSIRYDKAIGDREIVDLWRIELNSKRREKFAVADLNDILMLNGKIFAPTGTKLFLGRKVDESIPMGKPMWEVVGSKGDWRSSSATWLKDGSAIISSTWDADLKSDVLVIEQFTPQKKSIPIDLNIDNFLISSISKDNEFILLVWGDDSVRATGTVTCTLDIEHEKATCGKIRELDYDASSTEGLISLEDKTNLRKFAPYAKEYEDILYLRLKSGGYIKLANGYDCMGFNSCRIYKLLDYYVDNGFYVLRLHTGEPTEYFLSSDITGKQFYIQSDPIISPDKKHLVAVSSFSSFDIDGVFVWRFEDEKVVSELSFETGGGNGGYTFVKWEDERTLLLNRVYDAEKKYCPKVPTMTIPVTLKKENNEWKFIDDPSGIICKDLYPGSLAYNELEKEKSFGKYFNNKNHVLSLRLKSGDYKEFSGLEDCDKRSYCGPFYFINYFKDIGFYLVCNGDYRCEDGLLVSDKTGQEYPVFGNLIFSPDRSILFSHKLYTPFNKNTVVFWRIKGDELIEIPLENNNTDFSYGSYGLRNWQDNSTFLFSITDRSNREICPDTAHMLIPVTIKISKDGWNITEDRSPKGVECQ